MRRGEEGGERQMNARRGADREKKAEVNVPNTYLQLLALEMANEKEDCHIFGRKKSREHESLVN